MTSRSSLSYKTRAETHPNPLVRELFTIAERKKTNVVLSADLTTTDELLAIARQLGPYITVLKTHIDILSDLSPQTTSSLQKIAQEHDFLIFEDRKFIDIGNTVQKQYHGGALRISEWAHIINASVLAGPGIIDALAETAASTEVTKMGHRGCLILAEMTSKGSLAVGEYTIASIDIARRHPKFVIGFVSTTALSHLSTTQSEVPDDEDFVVLTTGVNMSTKGDKLGQQYNTPAKAVAGGADFIISGRGIYAAEDPVAAVKMYREEGWTAYLERTGQ